MAVDPAAIEVAKLCPFDVWRRALKYLELHRGTEGAGRVLTIRIGLDDKGRPSAWGSGVVPPTEHCWRGRRR